MVGECVAFGVDDDRLGQAIQVIATAPADGELDTAALLLECRTRMPAYMLPAGIEVRSGPLPRNPNGKIDRKTLSTEWIEKKNAA
jgi:acyl-CoA synthetase (AMP-forming)/AMP-acid ligase II